MRLVIAPSESKAREAARRRGLRPGYDCILVWDVETIHMTCLQDYIHRPIEEDPLGIDSKVRLEMNKYLQSLNEDPRSGFGWRNWHAELDNGSSEVIS